jgi:hypothetical protein
MLEEKANMDRNLGNDTVDTCNSPSQSKDSLSKLVLSGRNIAPELLNNLKCIPYPTGGTDRCRVRCTDTGFNAEAIGWV